MTVSADLIDTTEMYLKTIFELEEDGVVPLRARIVERLGHSGPTVSQTVARMERDGLVTVREDRHLDLTPMGRSLARDVMRKHTRGAAAGGHQGWIGLRLTRRRPLGTRHVRGCGSLPSASSG